MQVKLSKEFEYIFKAVLDRFEWEKKNTEMHGETFKPSSIINELAELVKTEASFQLGYNDDLKDLKCLCWVLDWDKYPFTQVLWMKLLLLTLKVIFMKESTEGLEEGQITATNKR